MNNTTIIYYTNTEEIATNAALLNSLLSQLPQQMQGRALRYRFNKDKANYIVGRLLIKQGLKDCGLSSTFENIAFSEKGKPSISETPFNISHSGQMVACAFSSKGAVGIDVELIKPIDLNDFKRFFMAKEMADIKAAENPISRFYWYWTRKESIIKALGVDLGYLHQVEIDPTKPIFLKEKEEWHLQDFELKDKYVGALCTEKPTIVKLTLIKPRALLENASA